MEWPITERRCQDGQGGRANGDTSMAVSGDWLKRLQWSAVCGGGAKANDNAPLFGRQADVFLPFVYGMSGGRGVVRHT